MEYYLAIQRNKVLIHVKVWMNLENIMHSARSLSHKIKFFIQLILIPNL